MAKFNFDPVNGLSDVSFFPTAPTSEAAARQQFMVLFNQLKAFLNSGTLEAGMLGGKAAADYLLTTAASTAYAKATHSHSEYSTTSHTHVPLNCGFGWGTGAANNADGKPNGTIYYRIEA